MTVLVWLSKHNSLVANQYTDYRMTDAGKLMDESVRDVQKTLGPHLARFGQRHDNSNGRTIFDILDSDRFSERRTP